MLYDFFSYALMAAGTVFLTSKVCEFIQPYVSNLVGRVTVDAKSHIAYIVECAKNDLGRNPIPQEDVDEALVVFNELCRVHEEIIELGNEMKPGTPYQRNRKGLKYVSVHDPPNLLFTCGNEVHINALSKKRAELHSRLVEIFEKNMSTGTRRAIDVFDAFKTVFPNIVIMPLAKNHLTKTDTTDDVFFKNSKISHPMLFVELRQSDRINQLKDIRYFYHGEQIRRL